MQEKSVATGPLTTGRNSWLKTTAGVAMAGLALGVFLAYALRSAPSSSAATAIPCANRLVVVDTSSSARGSDLPGLAQELVTAAADSAVVCESQLAAYGVAGGGEVTPIVTSDDLERFSVRGPNIQIRQSRFQGPESTELQHLVTNRLLHVYNVGNAATTSIPALFVVAAEQAGPDTTATLVTTGVNHDASVDLNRPLASGEGAQLARTLTVPRLHTKELTMVGLGQVDSHIPPPSPTWSEQILAFNRTLCSNSGVLQARLFEMASVTQLLS